MYKLLLLYMLANPQINLEIWHNPATSHGQAVKQQLTTDYTEVCNNWPTHERIMGLNAIVEHEFERRRIHKYFRVKFVEYSDDVSFRVGAGNRIRIPPAKMADPRELGYVEFFSYVLDTHFRDHFNDLREKENQKRWESWHTDRREKLLNFTKSKKLAGYTFYEYESYDEEYFFLPLFGKNGESFLPQELGWQNPPDPLLIPSLKEKSCPLDNEWVLPK